PFANRHRRITRILSERLLESRHLPPARRLYHGEDVVLRRDDFAQLTEDAVALSQKFHDGLTAATAHGVDYQGVSTPCLAGRLDAQWAREHKLDPEEFVTWVSSNQAGIGSLSEALERFTDWRESLNYR